PRVPGAPVDLRDERPCQRAPPDVTGGRRADPVRAASPRGFLDADLAGLDRQLAHVAALAGEPQVAVAVECGRVEVRVGGAARHREYLHLSVGPADPHDRVLAAIGDPRSLVRSLDYPVRARARAERDQFGVAGLRIEPAQVAARLGREPDAAVRSRREVMNAGAARGAQRPRLHLAGLGEGGRRSAEWKTCRRECADDGAPVHQSHGLPLLSQAVPQTSWAVSITSRNLSRCASTAILLPCTVLEKPHWGDSASCSIGAYCAASAMRRLSVSLFSSSPNLVVTRPSTAVLPLGRKRSGRKSPERSSSYSMKYASRFISLSSASATGS